MNNIKTYKIGIDVGSTTLKIVVLDDINNVLHKVYTRHKANVNKVFSEEMDIIAKLFPSSKFRINITGSAGMGIAERTGIPFVQEVVSAIEVIKRVYPEAHTMIDLGGEDAKIVFFEKDKQPDIRMNGSCAGGTGAFIDQMADLMNISVAKLSDEAMKYQKIYPVASRCGVFAKTDVQNLIARNVSIPDVAMSVFQTVTLQTITTLARGRDITPKILCVGGPLTFIPALRDSFRKTLKLNENDLILPENSAYFPAWGCALLAEKQETQFDIAEFKKQFETENKAVKKEVLPRLFANEADYKQWKENRKLKKLKIRSLVENEKINCFLGIDSGSTTTKILIMDQDDSVVFNFYAPNAGNPLKKVVEGLTNFYQEAAQKNVSFNFVASAATGYGEDLIKSALNLDFGIVETMAHLSGAQYVDPNVSFVLDIGGQDMKSIFTKNGLISNIELNEACSSGCGSFLQNFAATMNLSLAEFTREACLAESPSDLGSRCTVFMNSKVKQSLRENAALGDISAGLVYSVVKNCLFKVLKISNLNQLGNNIVVQGGTFRNDAVYRALELLSEKSVSSTDHPELMGALGAALYAQRMWQKNNHKTQFTGEGALLDANNINTKELQCKGCTNNCTVLRFKFENGNVSYAGNKCEKIFYNKASAPEKGYNAFDLKTKVLFDREAVKAPYRNIRIGIPRVLNMFENYPFWHTLLTACGFEVVLSPESTFSLYQRGVGSVMSDNICFPAKVAHGHILSLVDMKVDRIFYPIVPKEEKEFDNTNNSFNCPVVSGYPEVIRSAMEPKQRYGIPLDKPVTTFSNNKALERACFTYLSQFGVDKNEFTAAFKLALAEREKSKNDLKAEQKIVFEKAKTDNKLIFIVAGRPYHADPLIHQKVGQILSDLGAQVLTDDVFRQPYSFGFSKLNMVSQWSYPNRVVQTALEVAKLPQNVQMIQLNSFGCGPDSFFMEETGNILKEAGKNHTVLRIDEIASPGSIRLRLRSLIESLKVASTEEVAKGTYGAHSVSFKKEDRQRTVLIPWFTDFLSPLIPPVAALAGYKFVNAPKTSKQSADIGLKYGNNEVCYPSTLVLGDIISELQSGKHDIDNMAVAITQTGGQCRATNYLAQIKVGLVNAGFPEVPVIAVAPGGVHQNEQDGFKLPIFKILDIAIYGFLFGDTLQQMYSSTIIREKNKGETQKIFDFYIEKAAELIPQNNYKLLLKLLEQAVLDFNQVIVENKEFTKVGLIGEIFVKYNNYGQAHITEWLREQNMEVVTPPMIDFMLTSFVNTETNEQNGIRRGSKLSYHLTPWIYKLINKRISKVEKIAEKFRFYMPNESIFAKAEYAKEIIDLSNQFGEGWAVAGEIASFARHGINRVVCVQPFGCIANHIVAKGVERRIKKFYPSMNLLYLDIDGGMAHVNLQNRLHFLIND